MKKKTVKYILFYFLIQLPLAIYVIRGGRLSDVLKKDKSKQPEENVIEINNGDYLLFDYSNGVEIGKLHINRMNHGDEIRMAIVSKEYSGKDKYLQKEYAFRGLNIKDIPIELKVFNSCKYWQGYIGSEILITVNLDSNKYGTPIPGDLVGKNRSYYLVTILSEEDMQNLSTRLPLNQVLYVRSHESPFSAIFYTDKDGESK